jgi:FMN phosphatase YigB (HAD superfamily)
MVIGDIECEILGGKAAGIKTCLYNTNNISLDIAPDFCLDSLKNLLRVVN